MVSPLRANAPTSILAVLLALWVGCGAWVVQHAPFCSGTDESIEYVAFSAAKNRWATEEDFHRHAIDHFYYPPLYFLVFAPFWGDEPSFVAGYPRGDAQDPNYASRAGRRTVSASYASRVPSPLARLYRQAKYFSLCLGLTCLVALAATLRLLFPGPSGWWVVLFGTAPAIFLPQFLYYSTLVNNDTLLNALCALASLAFTAAVLALRRGFPHRFLWLSLAVGVCIGLAFLTKLSAAVLLPLPFGLAYAWYEAGPDRPWQKRAGRSLALLSLLTAAIVVSGGWWLGYQAWRGDWNSFRAHRLAHPWAATNPGDPLGAVSLPDNVAQIIRSFYALFSGALFVGVPDLVVLAWLALLLAIPAAAVVTALAGGGRPPGSTEPGAGKRRVIWVVFAGVVSLNWGAVLINLHFFVAAYGRLLFPSVVAMHAIAAAVVARILRGRPRALAAATLVLVSGTGLLFGWTFRQRLAPAVLQPPEDVRVLNGLGSPMSIGPVWASPMEQPLVIPPGNLVAFRTDVMRTNCIPQLGAALEGSLTFVGADGGLKSVPLRRTALGDNGFSLAWTELELRRPLVLGEATRAILTLQGTPPAWPAGLTEFRHMCSEGGTPAQSNGTTTPCALCVAAVYRSTAPARRPLAAEYHVE